MSKGSNGASQAAQTSANTQSSALNQIEQLIGGQQGQLGPLQSLLTPFFTNEMNTGLNPQFQENAQNQLQQNFSESLSSILGNTAPGQNPNGKIQGAQDALLSSSANLGGQLAGESQQVSQAGASGLESLLQLISGVSGGDISALGGIFNTSGQQAENYTNLAAQQQQQQGSKWSSLLTSPGTSGFLGSLGSLFAGGGAAGGLSDVASLALTAGM